MKIYKFKEIDSTNTFLKNLEKKRDYDLVIAERQILGRGRRGNKWSSEKGGAYFSFLLEEKENISPKDYVRLPLLVGYSLLKTLEKLENLEFKFKWTNDIYVKDKKLSGILVEKKEKYFIIGVGINLNNEIEKGIVDKGISLKSITNKTYEKEKLIFMIIEDFKENFNFYLNGNWEKILKYLNLKNYLKGKKITIDLRNRIEEGIGKDILETGELLVRVGDENRVFSIGEIHIKKSLKV